MTASQVLKFPLTFPWTWRLPNWDLDSKSIQRHIKFMQSCQSCFSWSWHVRVYIAVYTVYHVAMFHVHTLPTHKCKLKSFCLSNRPWLEKDGSGYGLHFLTAPKYETLVLGSAWPNEKLQLQERSLKDDSWFCQVLVALHSFFRCLQTFVNISLMRRSIRGMEKEYRNTPELNLLQSRDNCSMTKSSIFLD